MDAQFLLHISHNAGVYVAAAGAHQNAGQRGQAHAGVHALAGFDRGDGAAVAQMAGDHLQIAAVQVLSSRHAHIAVAGAVRAIAADGVLSIHLIGNAVHIRLGGHGLMERGVEHNHVGDLLAKYSLGAAQALHGAMLCTGSQRCDLFDFVGDGIGDDLRFGKELGALHHAVTDGGNLALVFHHSALARGHHFDHLHERLRVRGERHLLAPFAAVGLGGDLAAFNADALAQTFAQHAFVRHINELIFQRAGTAVDDQNFHSFFFLQTFQMPAFLIQQALFFLIPLLYNGKNSFARHEKGFMLKIVGIVAEYDPFHAGHAWQIQQAREAGARAVVCDEPFRSPAGRIRSVPHPGAGAGGTGGRRRIWCCPARSLRHVERRGFAAAGVHLLSMLGCVDTLCFGAETPDPELLHRTAQTLRRPEFQREMRHALRQGGGFCRSPSCCGRSRSAGRGSSAGQPNNILGVEYCKAIQAQKSPLQVFALARRGAAHGEATPGDGFASASALRTLFQAEGADAMSPYVPAACLPLYLQAQSEGLFHDPTAGSIAILSRLRGLSAQGSASCPRRERRPGAPPVPEHPVRGEPACPLRRFEDQALRPRPAAPAGSGRRAGVRKADPALSPYLHVLGASEQGLAVLKTAKETAHLPSHLWPGCGTSRRL